MDSDGEDPRDHELSPRPLKKLRIAKMTAEMRAKLVHGVYARPPQSPPDEAPPPPSELDRAKESAFNPKALEDCGLYSDNFMSDITNYVPIGCLRVLRDNLHMSTALWDYQTFWAALALPMDICNRRDSPFLHNQTQEMLFRSRILSSYEILFTHGFIRLEFKVNDDATGQLRVYLLPNHLVRLKVKKVRDEVEKVTKTLMREVDIAPHTWAGNWNPKLPVLHVHPALNETDTRKESLLDIYNSLPSPKPCLKKMLNPCSRRAMETLLKNDVHGLITTLYPYQRSSAAAMFQREVSPGLVLDPRLVELIDHHGQTWYCDPDKGYNDREPRRYEEVRGGILAENMGLGKTLICLTLILASRDIYSTAPPQYSLGLLPTRKVTGSLLEMSAAALGRHGIPWKIAFALSEEEGYELKAPRKAIQDQPGYYIHVPDEPSRSTRIARDSAARIYISTTTLVVVPPNLIQQWLDEIKKHTTGLKVLALASMRDILPSAVDLLDYDIILFTKTRFEKEGKDLEQSPLIKIHFKRIIYDEGHTVGNSSAGAQTESFALIENLKISARWVVSGTPTPGLYSTEKSGTNMSTPSDAAMSMNNDARQNISHNRKSVRRPDLDQERKDLMKLGNIAKYFLKTQPWASTSFGNRDDWQQYVLQARHGAKSHGSAACLRTTLEGLMIKHMLSDVEKNVVLPPLSHTIVRLEPCLVDKMTMNLFNIMVITNAVASERKDVDYFFHPTQRKSLQSLVTNLREGSFFWSGFEVAHVQSTIDNAQAYLDKEEKVATAEEIALLKQVVSVGTSIVSNNIFQQICHWHEIPLSVENDFPDHLRRALSLDSSADNPTLMGASALFDAQKYVHDNPRIIKIVDGLIVTAQKSFKTTEKNSNSFITRSGRVQDARLDNAKGKALAGGVSTGTEFTPKKLIYKLSPKIPQLSPSSEKSPNASQSGTASATYLPSIFGRTLAESIEAASTSQKDLVSSTNALNGMAHSSQYDGTKFLQSSRLMSTASSKLSYLLDRIVVHHKSEKILVFYESDNIGWYLAQSLECLNIKHLIYSKGLKSEQRAKYVVTFNRTEKFRVLLMDVSQAAYGLDMSSASRVYFVNPVFSPQVEAQAVKRAHRIGQLKPVYVETLVLTGSIEEVIVDRRGLISNEEHQKYKSILDDQTIYDWIRNLKLLPMALENVPGPEQMASLVMPQRLFDNGSGAVLNPDDEVLKIENYDRMTEEPASLVPLFRTFTRDEQDMRNLRIVLDATRLASGCKINVLRLTHEILTHEWERRTAALGTGGIHLNIIPANMPELLPVGLSYYVYLSLRTRFFNDVRYEAAVAIQDSVRMPRSASRTAEVSPYYHEDAADDQASLTRPQSSGQTRNNFGPPHTAANIADLNGPLEQLSRDDERMHAFRSDQSLLARNLTGLSNLPASTPRYGERPRPSIFGPDRVSASEGPARWGSSTTTSAYNRSQSWQNQISQMIRRFASTSDTNVSGLPHTDLRNERLSQSMEAGNPHEQREQRDRGRPFVPQPQTPMESEDDYYSIHMNARSLRPPFNSNTHPTPPQVSEEVAAEIRRGLNEARLSEVLYAMSQQNDQNTSLPAPSRPRPRTAPRTVPVPIFVDPDDDDDYYVAYQGDNLYDASP